MRGKGSGGKARISIKPAIEEEKDTVAKKALQKDTKNTNQDYTDLLL